MAYRTYDVTLSANETRVLYLSGESLSCLESTASFEVAFDEESGGGLFDNGFHYGPPSGFRALRLTETQGAPNTLRLGINDGFFRDGRFQFNGVIDVRNTDAFYNAKVLSGVAFAGGLGVNAGASRLAYTELFNLAGSGVDLVVTRAVGSMAATGTLTLRSQATRIGGTAYNYLNKMLGGASGAAELNYGDVPSSPGHSGTPLYAMRFLADETEELIKPVSYPVVVPPGYSLSVCCETGAATMYASFEWEERSR